MALDHALPAARARQLERAICNVDGVVSDGRLNLGPDGAEYKAFDGRDDYGMVALRRAGVVIITGCHGPVPGTTS